MSWIIKRAVTAVAPTLALTLGLSLTTAVAASGAAAASSSPAGSAATVVAARTVAHNANGTLHSRLKGMTASGQKVTGTFTPLRVVKHHGVVSVRGLVQGVVHRPGPNATFAVLHKVPLASVNGTSAMRGRADVAARTCSVLHLTLGPLDLNLLGLTVHLDKVVLNIDAHSGSGNLLGNLLCAVAGLLDGGLGGQLGNLTALLNQILGLLNLGA